MKTKLFTITLTFISFNVFAQITVTDYDIMDIGDVITQANDSMPSSLITIGNSGPNQSWDFSSLQEMDIETIEVVSPVGTLYGSMYPNANICVEDNGDLLYLDKSHSSGVKMVGFGDLPVNVLMLPLPLTDGLIHQDGPNIIMDSVLVNIGLFDNSLAPVISLNPLHDQVDSLKINATITSDFTVDAWGNITIPLGNYEALRLKIEETTTTQFSVYCSTAGLAGGWFSAETFFPIETEIANRYQWWSNNPSVKFMLAELEMDSLGNVEFATFLTQNQTTVFNNILSNSISVFPNPSSDKIVVNTDLNHCNYELVDVKGNVINSDNFNYSTEIDLSKNAKGIYFLKLVNQSNIITKKIVIE